MPKKRTIIPKRKVITGMGTGVFLALLIHALTPLHAKINRPAILYWHGDLAEKKIALTFDDGPNDPYTSEVLKVLKDNHVRATFFLVGKNVEANPQAAREIVAAGHAIGNHSYDHRNLVTRTNAQVRDEILKAEKAIEEATGQKTALFRPPYGDKDAFTLRQTRQLGYVMIEWSVSAEDWRRPGPRRIVANVVKDVRNGSIILMHDGDKIRRGDRSQTVAALPQIIAQLRQEGYEFVTIPELLKLN
jgi:polysaccharide deacetylase family sporulation protein PdaB